VLIFVLLILSKVSHLYGLHFASLIVEFLQFLLDGLIVLFVQVELEELCFFEVLEEFLVEGVGFEVSPDQSHRKMEDYYACNDSSTNYLSAHWLKNLDVMLVVQHSSTEEGESDFMENMNKIT
jgi:hypothetical protein